MESYGEILKKQRESKNLDLEKISREISIDKKYLQGLEDEDSNAFPGEAYMIGFLRNYSSYLELDPNLMLKLYNNKKIQEAPVPVELIAKPKPKWLAPAIIAPIALVVVVVLCVSIPLLTRNKNDEDSDAVVSSKNKNKQYELTDEKLTQRLYKGDQLLVPVENSEESENEDGEQTVDSSSAIVLTVRDTLSSFGLDTPAGVFYTDLAEESEIDINGDSNPDLIVYVSDLSYTDENRGVEVSVLLKHGTSAEDSSTSDVYSDEIPLITELKNNKPQKVILEDNRAYPFTLNASFLGVCLFRDKVDSNDSVETYFARGEVFTATAHNGIRLWMSNGNTVKCTIIADTKTFDLEIGASGQVLVEDIKWIKDVDGKYKLVVIELD